MAKQLGYGATLEVGDGASPEVFSAVAYVSNISVSGYSVDAVDVTTHDSANNFKEFIPGMVDGGEVSFDIVFDPDNTTHDETAGGLKAIMDSRSIKNWKVTFADATNVWSFTGFMTSFEFEVPIEDAITASCTIKTTAKPTLV